MSEASHGADLLLDGRLVPAAEGGTFDDVNPATEEVIGVTADGTAAEFGLAFDSETLTRAMEDWVTRGLAQEEFMTPEDVAGVLIRVIRTAAEYPGICLEELTVRSASAVTASYEQAVTDAGGPIET